MKASTLTKLAKVKPCGKFVMPIYISILRRLWTISICLTYLIYGRNALRILALIVLLFGQCSVFGRFAKKREGHNRDEAVPPNQPDCSVSRCGPTVQLVRRLKGRNRTEARNFSDDQRGRFSSGTSTHCELNIAFARMRPVFIRIWVHYIFGGLPRSLEFDESRRYERAM